MGFSLHRAPSKAYFNDMELDIKRGPRAGRVTNVVRFSGCVLQYPTLADGQMYSVVEISYCTRCGRQFTRMQGSNQKDCGRCGHITFIPGSRRVQ